MALSIPTGQEIKRAQSRSGRFGSFQLGRDPVYAIFYLIFCDGFALVLCLYSFVHVLH